MKLLDGEVVPGDSLTIDADMKKGDDDLHARQGQGGKASLKGERYV